mgnify:CR=1 FL=1
MASFNPADHTVKEATKLLDGLSDDDLSGVYDSELEGKGRRSLLDAISAARDELREGAAEEAAEADEPEAAPPQGVGHVGKEVFVGGKRYLVMTCPDGSTVSVRASTNEGTTR